MSCWGYLWIRLTAGCVVRSYWTRLVGLGSGLRRGGARGRGSGFAREEIADVAVLLRGVGQIPVVHPCGSHRCCGLQKIPDQQGSYLDLAVLSW